MNQGFKEKFFTQNCLLLFHNALESFKMKDTVKTNLPSHPIGVY